MTMAMELIRHIAGLYSGKAIKGDFTQVYITGNEIWMAQQVLAEQAEGAQGEQEAFEAWCRTNEYETLRRLDGSGYNNPATVRAWSAWQARAGLAQPSPAPELDDQAFDANAERLTFQALGPGAGINPEATSIDDIFLDESPAVALDFSRPLETEKGEPVKWICADVIEYKSARVCVAQDTGLVYSSPYIDLKIRNVVPAPAPAPELERPEVVAWSNWKVGTRSHVPFRTEEEAERSVNASEIAATQGGPYSVEQLMTVAQHAGIIAKWADLLNRANDRADAAQARVAELENQQPVAWITETDPDVTMGRGINWFPKNVAKLPVGTKLYAAPVAQAGQVPEGYMLITQDQVERHATTAWECPPQSRVVLVSTLKRLHEKNSAVPQPAGGE
ncbi:hypothetical protein QO209_31065 [Pseudomonas citronellolis]|uniref:hypothetical protein n=1 Tax=Pseudomonas citronellolis TaxID=53408 RepID=UPI00264785E3|nr:hypothetical protein [Pseudomonas citronellolis]MDN6876907.1 hypothetical protein [Pseudomonas citronellolis]